MTHQHELEPTNGSDHHLPQFIALAGNPNSGKTTLFNALTGLRQKVANYPGVTVERKQGACTTPSGRTITLLDLPGTYSLESRSPDEDIVRDVLLGLREDTPRPETVIVVVDASNLERNLYLVTQVMELGIPVVVALNMFDTAASLGRSVNATLLQERLGIPVVPLIASKGKGVNALKALLDKRLAAQAPQVKMPQEIQEATRLLASDLSRELSVEGAWVDALALRMLTNERMSDHVRKRWGHDWKPIVQEARHRLIKAGVAPSVVEPTTRYRWIAEACREVVATPEEKRLTQAEKVDHVLTHRVFGPIIFLVLMAIVFQSIYTWAQVPMNAIQTGLHWMGAQLTHVMPEGPLRSLLIDGVLGGVGAVVTFLPQIAFLFFFLALLDASGYLARAAFLMDKLMSSVGLHGRSFIPLMSSFACAIPGIMATRTIENKRDRFLTILIAPLMSCSARLPVYTLMIAAFIPNRKVWGIFGLPGLTLLSMYLLGIFAAMFVGWVFRRTLFKGQPSPFLMELPPYRAPVLRNVALAVWEQSKQFLTRAGTTILAISMLLWFLTAYPQHPPRPGVSREVAAGEQIRSSFAGHLGRLIEPVVRPLGFDWKIGIGLIGSFAAREVIIGTLGTVYNIEHADESSVSLQQSMHNDRYPDGRPVFTPLVAVTLMIYFVLALQCMSTVAIVRRETNSWQWPLFMIGYLTGMAYIVSLAIYQVGHALGWG